MYFYFLVLPCLDIITAVRAKPLVGNTKPAVGEALTARILSILSSRMYTYFKQVKTEISMWLWGKIYILEELNRKKQTHLHLLLRTNGTELSFSPNCSWHQEQMLRPVHRYTQKQTGVNLNLATCVNYWARGRVGGAKRPVLQNKEQTSSRPSPAPFTTSFNITACVCVCL